MIASLAPFMRRRARDGARASNPLLDRCESELVIAAVMYFEECEESMFAHWERQRMERNGT